jgi:carbon-monoxide dehydrogenase iron sulfur subunit
MACSMTHLSIFSPRKGLLRVEIDRLPKLGTSPSRIDVPIVCRQCNPAPCAEVCPEGAIGKGAFGAWVVNSGECTGCGICVDACPYRVMLLDPQEGLARKCDLCEGNPACVRYCPMEALTF